jgi:hypothetical protein
MPKYLRQLPVLENPHPQLFPHLDRPSLTPIQNKQNYSLVLSILINIILQHDPEAPKFYK